MIPGYGDRTRPPSHARSGRRPWESRDREPLCPFLNLSHVHTFNFLQMNVLVDSEGTPRIAGLGSASVDLQSCPEAWSEGPHELTRCRAPELVNPEGFGLSKPQTTKASDVYALGVLAYQVKRAPIPIPAHQAQNVGYRFSRVTARSPTCPTTRQST